MLELLGDEHVEARRVVGRRRSVRRPDSVTALRVDGFVAHGRFAGGDRQLLTVLAPQHERERDRADRHGGVGDVERPEANVAHADVDEVDDAARAAKAIDEIARRAAPGETEREDAHPVAALGRAIEPPQHDERDDARTRRRSSATCRRPTC